VFYYEVLNSAERACLLAKAAFDDAIPKMDLLDEESYKGSIFYLLGADVHLFTQDHWSYQVVCLICAS